MNAKKDQSDNEEKEAESPLPGENVRRRNWGHVIVHELLYDAQSLINHKYGNYCLQTALSACIESKSYVNGGEKLLAGFIETVHPLLHLLRLNVKKEMAAVMLSATDNRKR
eukprot:TRINITY_DN2298_c0_g1_i1.p1 TRINITY_DN2298_c0_g1~~TRINITY_DN2298_c0_g1_i1.p1  ORF type:complete len:121 (-),score=33.49 TRINITY_DN2298_c0_g1_i1:112-444(-)